MPTRITTVRPARTPVRAVALLAVGIAAAALLSIGGCSDNKSGAGSGSKPAG